MSESPETILFGSIFLAIVVAAFGYAFIYVTSGTVEQHETTYVCTPHRYERGECMPEIKPGDTTRYCPRSLCGDSLL